MATTTSSTRPHLPLPTTGRLPSMNITIYGWTTRSLVVDLTLSTPQNT
jgi:hypothetical protein